MDRDQEAIPGDGSHLAMTFLMRGTTERDGWCRTFPWPCPSTHELAYEWDAQTMKLRVWVRPRERGGQAPAPTETNPDPRKALDALSIDELLTRGAEIGAEVRRGMSKAQLVAVILTKQGATAKP